MQKDDSIPSDGTKADSEQKDEDLFVRQHRSKPNVICRFLSEWFRKRKIRKFEREFEIQHINEDHSDNRIANLQLIKENA